MLELAPGHLFNFLSRERGNDSNGRGRGGGFILFFKFQPKYNIVFLSSEDKSVCEAHIYTFTFNVLLSLSSSNSTDPIQFLYRYPKELVSRGTY